MIAPPLSSINTALPESSELATQDQTVSPGGDFSALLFSLAAPQNVLPVTEVAAQPIGQPIVDSLESGQLSLAASLPALQPPPPSADVGDLSGGNAAQPIVGTTAEIVKEISSSTPSLPSQTVSGALFRLQTADQRSTDRQIIAPETSEASKLSETDSMTAPAVTLPASDELMARLPGLAAIGGKESNPVIPAAVFVPNGEQTQTQFVRETERLIPAPETGALAPFTLQRVENSTPVVVFSGAQSAVKPDSLETHATDSDDGATISQSAPSDITQPVVTAQRTAAEDHQELPNSAVPVKSKPGENSPKDHQDISGWRRTWPRPIC